MANHFTFPRQQVADGNGYPIPSARVRFFSAGTSTPLAVYSDAALSVAIAQPILADASGRLPRIFLPATVYKVRVENAAGVLIYEEDNCDPGFGIGTGALPIASGGTSATTAAAARAALGVPTTGDVTAVAADLTTLKGRVDRGTNGSGEFGNLSDLDTVSRANLAPGFGWVCAQRLLSAQSALAAGSTAFAMGTSLPTITDGVQVASQAITPLSASSRIRVTAQVTLESTSGSAVDVAVFLCSSTATNAEKVAHTKIATNTKQNITVLFDIPSTSTATRTLSLRAATSGGAGTLHINRDSAGGNSVYGGVAGDLIVEEWIQA